MRNKFNFIYYRFAPLHYKQMLGLHAEISVRVVPKERRFERELKMTGNKNKNAIWALLLSLLASISTFKQNYKQLLDEVFVISGIIKVSVSVISLSLRLRLITLTKTESNNCFIILYLQVISQFLAGSMKRIEKPFLLRCPRT